VSEQSRSRVEVIAGKVDVTGGGGRLVLPAGYGTIVEQGKAPAPATKLLPAPVVEAMPEVIRQLPLALGWKRVPGASAYRVRIFSQGADSVPLLDARVEHHRFSTSSLPDGKYLVRLRGMDAAGLEGKETEIPFVLDARPLPSMGIRPEPEITLHGDSVSFEWSTPPEVGSYRFQLSPDPLFGTRVEARNDLQKTRLKISPLQPGVWFWRVASVYEGEQGPWSHVQRFELRPEPEVPDVSITTNKDQLRLHWQSGRPGQRYHLQIAEDQGFHSMLVDEILNEPHWSSSRPDVPVYFRAQVVDDDGYAGAWSPAQAIFPEPEPWYLFGIPAIAIILLAL